MKALSPDPLGWRPKSQLVDFSIAAFGTSTQCVGKKILETCLSAPKSIYGFPGNSLHCWDIQVVINFETSNLAHGSSGIFLLAVCFIHAPPCSGLWDRPHNLQSECKIKVWDSVFKLKSQGSDKGALKQAQGSLKGGALGHWPWVTAQVKCPRSWQFSLHLGSWTQQTPLLFASGSAHRVGDPDRADQRAERKKTFYSSAAAAVSDTSHNGEDHLFADSTAAAAEDPGSSILRGF